MEKRGRTNRESYPSKKHQEADVSPKTRHVLEDPSGMDTEDHYQKKVTKEANQQDVSL